MTGVSDAARRVILIGIMLGIFLGILDQTIVATALPRVVRDLGGANLYTWVTTVYLLTSTVSIPFYGRLSDLFGRRPMFLGGIALFILGSVLSAVAQEMWQLIGARAVQGLGAGALVPVASAVIGDLYAPADRAKPQSLFGLMFALAVVIGPALGGYLTESVGWRSVFLVNVPLGAIAFGMLARTLPRNAGKTGPAELDWPGAIVLAASMIALLVGLANSAERAWTEPLVGGLIAAGILGTLAFLVVESRSRHPLIPLALFADRTFAGSMVASFFLAFGFYAAIVFLPLWFQTAIGTSPADSGFEVLPFLAGVVISAIAAGRIVARTGRYRSLLIISVIVAAIGAILVSRLTPETPPWALRTWMLIAGLGFGPTFSVFTVVVQNAVPRAALGAASGALGFFRQMGGAVGLAVLGTFIAGPLRGPDPAATLSFGIGSAFVVAGSLAVIALVATAAIADRPMRQASAASPSEPSSPTPSVA
jgi:EmrB/QacA subfamily drug resistance transporter